MVGRFGSREICDVTFKALTNDFVVGTKTFAAGQPVFFIDTATASSLEQATSVVYAQGGKGYNRLIAWEGEKTMTFSVTDALMSPLGLKILSGAGFSDASTSAVKHVHVTYDLTLSNGQGEISFVQLRNELGLPSSTTVIKVCNDTQLKPFATVLDGNGSLVDWVDASAITFSGQADPDKANLIDVDSTHALSIAVTGEDYANKTIKLDFYVYMTSNVTEITIAPEDFGGNFYVEADTLYRNQNGKDMAATLTFPNVKIQSAFTISMSPTGDPSTFDFVMDAFPGYTYFDRAKKVLCDITVVGGDTSSASGAQHSAPVAHGPKE